MVVHIQHTRPQQYEAHKISSASMILLALIMQAVLREAKKKQLKLVGNTLPREVTL